MPQRQINNGNTETKIEIKVEPSLENYVEEENEMDFPGFENNSLIRSTANMECLPSWTSHATACLISQYKKFYSMVEQTARLRSRKQMFEIISLEMQKHGYFFSPQKCENKWKVLERKYKNLVFREQLKKPGRIKHYGHWEHKRALDEIFHETRRHVSLEQNDFSVTGGPVKFPQQAIMETNCGVKGDLVNASLTSTSANAEKCRDSIAIFETFFVAMNKNFALAEANRERRHNEKMALKQAELEIQRKMLKLKELKMEACKSQRKFIE